MRWHRSMARATSVTLLARTRGRNACDIKAKLTTVYQGDHSLTSHAFAPASYEKTAVLGIETVSQLRRRERQGEPED
jgi:hypothetical protein